MAKFNFYQAPFSVITSVLNCEIVGNARKIVLNFVSFVSITKYSEYFQHFRMDLDAIDILESVHLDPDDDAGDGVEEQESTTPIDELKEMVKKNLSFLGTPGQVDPSPLTMVSLKEKYPQVSILVDNRRELMLMHIQSV